MTNTHRRQVLEEAERIVNGNRNDTYDEPENNFRRIALLWTAYVGVEFSDSDVAVMNILQKVGRLQYTPTHRDSWVDIAGYAACGADVALAAEGEK